MASTAKAWAAGATGTAVAFLTGLQSAIADNVVTSQEWTTIALATVVGGAAAFGVTWAVPNKPTPPGGDNESRPYTQPH